MNYFIDTSSLIKYYYEEEGTEKITKIIDNSENEIYISEQDWIFVSSDKSLLNFLSNINKNTLEV
ncbi:MAG: hypothetical protein KDK36_09025 [Leptospiraceae bacterium]|nr:hypothetical protein [Leptospiraceae bacterium]